MSRKFVVLIVAIVHVHGVRLCLRTAASNGLIVHPPDYIGYGEPRWNDIIRVKPKKSEKNL
jgi:hypothetical protein